MFARVSSILLFALVATASVLPRIDDNNGGNGGQCNTGTMQCCNSVQPSNSPGVSMLAGLIGAVLPSVHVPVGLTCNPINVIGIGGNTCSAQSVCCTGNNYSGLIVIGCSPIKL